jgi:hypothetical protein
MLGGRRSVRPLPNSDVYAERANASLEVYNAELVPPATSWATVKSPLATKGFVTPTIAPKMRAFFKDSRFRLDGIINAWAWGSYDMGKHSISLPGSGTGLVPTVRNTDFQTQLVHLNDWQLNSKWYIFWNGTGSGMFSGSKLPRYQYPSFRVPQISTRTSGGPGPVGMRMQPRPRFTAVQRVNKYTATPRYYNTTSQGVRRRPTGGASNTNKTGG